MKLGFVVIYVENVNQTLDFYHKAFGLDIRMQYEESGISYGEMECDGAILAFASHEMGQMNFNGKYQKTSLTQDPFGQEIVFVDPDVDEKYNQAVNAGAISIAKPHDKPWGQRVAHIRANEGTLIEICSPMEN